MTRERTTRKDLEGLATVLNNCTNRPAGYYFVQYAYGQPRLMAADGSREVSPRLPAGQLADWLRAFIAGVLIGREV